MFDLQRRTGFIEKQIDPTVSTAVLPNFRGIIAAAEIRCPYQILDLLPGLTEKLLSQITEI